MSDVLTKAAEAVADRMKKYGPPDKHLADVAVVFNQYLHRRFHFDGVVVPRDIGNLMALLKLMRDANQFIDDNPVDVCGWMECNGRSAPVPERTDIVRVSPEELIGVIKRNRSKYPCENNVVNCTGHCEGDKG